MLKTADIHNMAYNYKIFCDYAGITFKEDANCDGYTGITGVTTYNNPIVSGSVRWSYTMFGDLITVRCGGVPDYQNSLHHKILHNEFDIPSEYKYRGYMTRHGFEEWLNDELLKIVA